MQLRGAVLIDVKISARAGGAKEDSVSSVNTRNFAMVKHNLQGHQTDMLEILYIPLDLTEDCSGS